MTHKYIEIFLANLSEVGPGMGDRFGLLPDFIWLDSSGEEPGENRKEQHHERE